MKENLIDKLHEADMFYFVLGSLISADSLIDVEIFIKRDMKYFEGLSTNKLKDKS